MATRSASGAAGWSLALALLLQIRVAGDPYGSWDRRSRPDPGTDWRFPADAWVFVLAGSFLAGWGWHWLLAIPWSAIPGKRASSPDLVEFDGECALCNGFIRLLIAEGGDGFRFRGTATGDSVVVGDRLRSDAVLYLAERLGGPWRLLGLMARGIPRRLRNFCYDFVARQRTRSSKICWPIPAHLRHLFVT